MWTCFISWWRNRRIEKIGIDVEENGKFISMPPVS
jgi:hypothetical protein